MKVSKYSTFCPPPVDIRAGANSGYGLLIIAIVTAMMVALISLSVTKLNQSAFAGINNSKIMLQAQQYAETEAQIIKATDYSNLIAHGKTQIQNSKGYYSEIILNGETNYSESIKQRVVSINIYKDGEFVPRYSLNTIKVSEEAQSPAGGVPVGTIIAWPSSSAPSEGGTWLLCNGDSFSSSTYPQLYAVLGKTTLPNLNARFLEGTTGTPGSTKSAGLPDIQGRASFQPHGSTLNGAFTSGSGGSGISGGGSKFYGGCTQFKASSYNSIYGASTTVQPASYTVRYYVKAA